MTEPSILRALVRFALPFLPILMAVFVRLSILLAVAFGVLLVMKNASARLKHLLWLSAIGGSLLVLVLSLNGPLFRVALRPTPADRLGALAVFSSALLPASSTFGLQGGVPPLAAEVWRQTSIGKNWINLWPSVMLFLWIAGTLSGWLRILCGRLQLVSLERESRTDTTDEYERMVRNLSRRVGIRREVRVVESERCATPLTRGIVYPVIFLPPALRGWSVAGKRSVLLHELRHVRRGDACSLTIAYGICSLLWFVPPVWAAYSRLYLEQEKACDAAVIEGGVKRHAYAACILNAAQLCREPALLAGLSFSGRRKKILKDRIQAIVRGGKTMKKGVILFGLAALLLGAAVLVSAAGEDTGKKYGTVYLTEYQVRNADEAAILDGLIQYENAFNSHDLRKLLSLFSKGAIYMPCGTEYTRYPIASQDCQDVLARNFSIFKFETYYDPEITVKGSKAVVHLLLETGDYLAEYTFVMNKEGQSWLVSEASYKNDRGKS